MAEMVAEIVAVGSEMLTPYRVDTNSLALTEQLNRLGVAIAFKTILGDSMPQLTEAARIAMRRADIVIFSGGLGPTEDDLTREAVAAALGVGMTRDEAIVDELRQRFRKRGIAIRENNMKQADVIDGAEVLPNANGTAPGLWIDTEFEGKRRILVLLPGVPRELKALYTDQVEQRLRAVVPVTHIATASLRMAVVPESEVDARTAPIYQQYTDVQTTILSTQGEIQLHFLCSKPTLAEAEARVAEVASRCAEEMEPHVFSTQNESPEQVVLTLLHERSQTLAVAESCTGGLLAQRITAVPGSSASFLGGAVVYSNQLKTAFADVPASLIEEHGAVSEPVARALAAGIRTRTGASIGVGITGIAGPDGATEAKPVGLVYLAIADSAQTACLKLNLGGDRERIRWFASQHVLIELRKRLLDSDAV